MPDWVAAPIREYYLYFADHKGSNIRHSALWKKGDSLHVFWSQAGDVPERILMSTIDLSVDWREWRETESIDILYPERPWEGAGAPPTGTSINCATRRYFRKMIGTICSTQWPARVVWASQK